MTVAEIRELVAGRLPVDLKNRQEVRLRSPGYWLSSIRSPTWVLEGAGGNIASLRAMARLSANTKVRFVEIKGADHFATLAPINEFIAGQILKDTGAECSIALSADEVNRHFATSRTAKP